MPLRKDCICKRCAVYERGDHRTRVWVQSGVDGLAAGLRLLQSTQGQGASTVSSVHLLQERIAWMCRLFNRFDTFLRPSVGASAKRSGARITTSRTPPIYRPFGKNERLSIRMTALFWLGKRTRHRFFLPHFRFKLGSI